jgi:hypothetical protein
VTRRGKVLEKKSAGLGVVARVGRVLQRQTPQAGELAVDRQAPMRRSESTNASLSGSAQTKRSKVDANQLQADWFVPLAGFFLIGLKAVKRSISPRASPE